ncbi:MAG: tRNA 2-thiocytidine(32) synthetase TtcA, partial [Stenotrophomonas sp.]
ALGNIHPSQLADPALFDFLALGRTAAPPSAPTAWADGASDSGDDVGLA